MWVSVVALRTDQALFTSMFLASYITSIGNAHYKQ